MFDSRRNFLIMSGAAGCALTGCSKTSPGGWRPSIINSVKGANNDIRIALIGMGRRAKVTLKAFSNMPGVRVVALCDPDFIDPREIHGTQIVAGN